MNKAAIFNLVMVVVYYSLGLTLNPQFLIGVPFAALAASLLCIADLSER